MKETPPPKKNRYRLQHYLALCGYGSRRVSEKAIGEGWVSVDGNTAQIGDSVSVGQDVRVQGVGVKWKRERREGEYYLFHKPSKTLCSHSDDTGNNRRLIYSFFQPELNQRLFCVGRLDYMTSGALLVTNDGDFVQKIAHPRHKIEKEYVVTCKREISDTLCEQFIKGIRVRGVLYRAKSCQKVSDHTVQVVLEEGKNRELRNVFWAFKIPIKKVHRVRIGGILLKGLAPGTYRKVGDKERGQLTRLSEKA